MRSQLIFKRLGHFLSSICSSQPGLGAGFQDFEARPTQTKSARRAYFTQSERTTILARIGTELPQDQWSEESLLCDLIPKG
jgi:hypothetical protein